MNFDDRGARKVSMAEAYRKEGESTMCTIYSVSELNQRTKTELSALFRKVAQELESMENSSVEHGRASSNLDNIKRALAHHRFHPKPPGC